MRRSVIMKKHMLSVVLAVLLVLAMSATAFGADTITVDVTGTYGQTEARSMLKLVNDFRTGRYIDGGQSEVWAYAPNGSVDTASYKNLGELKYDYELEKAAMQRAMETALQFSHERPYRDPDIDTDSWLTVFPDGYSSQTENIAYGYVNNNINAQQAFNSWCETNYPYAGQGHRRGMLSRNANRIGIGHVVMTFSGNLTEGDRPYPLTTEIHYWVMEIGYRSDSFGLTQTPAKDDEATLAIDVLKDNIKSTGVKTNQDSYTMNYGETLEFDDATSEIGLYSTMPPRFTMYWPDGKTSVGSYYVPVGGGYSIDIADKSIASVSGKNITAKKAGETSIIVKSELGGESKSVKLTVKPASIDDAEVTVSGSFTYDGKAKEPPVTVKKSGKTLIQGQDYSVNYSNNTDAGKATVTITGKGDYRGSCSKQFVIAPLTLTKDMFTVDDSGLVYNGKNQTPEITGKAGDLDLAEGVHYTVSFDPAANAGQYEARVTGKGNCEGDVTLTFKIQRAEAPPIMPEAEYTVPYKQETLQNSILNDAEGWEFDSADIGKELQIGDDNKFTAYYAAADKDNYKTTTATVKITRETCQHPDSAIEFRGRKAPDCENEGYTGDKYCNDCNTVLEVGKTVPALGHRYGAPEYTWSDDNKTATASMVCANDETHIVSETVETTYKVTKKPDCENKGIGKYTAAFKNKAFTGQTKDVEIEALGHAYGAPEYEWSVNNRVVTASMVCANDNSHVISEKVKTVYKVTKEPGCETKGTGTYTAMFSNKSFATQTKTVELDALGHKMTYHEAAEASCTEDGNNEYWQCDNCHLYWSEEARVNELAKEEIVIPKLGHDWSEWETVTEPTAEEEGLERRECSRCHDVEEKNIPRKEVTPAKTPENDSANVAAEDASVMTGADGTPLGKGASIRAAEKAITSMPDDKDPAGTEFGTLQLRSKKQAKTSVNLSWKRVPGAAEYYIFGNKCGKSNRMTLQKVVTGTSLKVKKILGNNNQLSKVKKGTYYKFIAVAVDGNGRVLSTSKVIHISTKGGKTGNYKTVKTRAVRNKVSLKKGKKFKLSGRGVAQSAGLKVRKHRGVAYESSNPAVARVTGKGVIKGVSKGKCYVYAYSQSGTFVKIKVTVK